MSVEVLIAIGRLEARLDRLVDEIECLHHEDMQLTEAIANIDERMGELRDRMVRVERVAYAGE